MFDPLTKIAFPHLNSMKQKEKSEMGVYRMFLRLQERYLFWWEQEEQEEHWLLEPKKEELGLSFSTENLVNNVASYLFITVGNNLAISDYTKISE